MIVFDVLVIVAANLPRYVSSRASMPSSFSQAGAGESADLPARKPKSKTQLNEEKRPKENEGNDPRKVKEMTQGERRKVPSCGGIDAMKKQSANVWYRCNEKKEKPIRYA